jgi:phosphohistidine phosphatase
VKFYLVQHGQACSKEVNPSRPLTEQGQETIERLASFLKRAGIKADRVIHSGKLRAIQTAEGLAKAIAPGIELEASGLINPNDNPRVFDWQSESWDGDTLIVGHLPFMAKLVSHLVIQNETPLITAYQPGTIVCLEFNNEAYWQINWMIRPELLC